ncbi:MAG: benzoate transporter [Candidatus Dactylopiibacterium carminicum]|uniref:Benzoate transporter n=1 Tax=Candidatus Dactylopiibacterium carminicum TaxID=857335 RepID=A0A272EN23_9RHOO|nr:glycosyltransferase family 2 protein [Candidatus Dactylopiibacterium carminicum]KAF7597941.1 glycosyltransferase family 2 protein [Candidatus Dactylopiibacterium carminicum]PAS91515.1 MAG: benzoate transporter [Candidatus Dactylopiibacterium carminicum]PAS93062.1 MAG: benzoate transporter [Candidatus Dactylopiibacterium carminicum]PAS96065.1 MAG: benzoate transporter [Candidatus Dactylopiibacterium carminicum]
MTERLPLSAVLITLNCAGPLRATLESLSFCDEIVAVDSGSTDGTLELLAEFGVRVVSEAWRGFGPQKQFAIEQATHDWVLCVDSDEIVSADLRASILQALQQPGFHCYQFPRCNRFLGRYLKHGEGYPDLSLRLFDRRQARWSDDVVHEKVITLGNVGRLSGDLLHHSEDTIESYLAKQNRYTTLAAQALRAEGQTVSAFKLLGSPFFRFIKFYLLRAGFRDGVPGLIHILIGCFNSFAKYAKMIELTRR